MASGPDNNLRPLSAGKAARTVGTPASKWRRGGMHRMGKVAAMVAAPAMRRRGLTNTELLQNWQAIAGEALAADTVPVDVAWPRNRMDGAALTMKVAPGLSVYVQHEAEHLIDRINSFFGYMAVGRIKIVNAPIGDAHGAKRHILPRHYRTTPAPDLPADMDPDLREALARLGRMVAAQDRDR